jgi:hypothetical protein
VLLAIVITLIIYFELLPILQTFIDNTSFCMQGGVGPNCPTPPLIPNGQTSTIILFMDACPYVILLGIFLTIVNYANPRREGG